MGRLLRVFGVGGPTVRTELTTATAPPGGIIEGVVEVTGGDHEVTIGYVDAVLQTEAGVEGGTATDTTAMDFHRRQVTPGFTLAPKQRLTFPLRYVLPAESPLTHAFGRPLSGMGAWLRTELEVAREIDRTDRDPIEITPLPAQQHVLAALAGLGCQVQHAGVERGRLRGAPQTLPFYQEITFLPGDTYGAALHRLDVSFVATDTLLHVVVELDRKVGPLADRDIFGQFTVDPQTYADTDWRALLGDWLDEATARRGPLF